VSTSYQLSLLHHLLCLRLCSMVTSLHDVAADTRLKAQHHPRGLLHASSSHEAIYIARNSSRKEDRVAQARLIMIFSISVDGAAVAQVICCSINNAHVCKPETGLNNLRCTKINRANHARCRVSLHIYKLKKEDVGSIYMLHALQCCISFLASI